MISIASIATKIRRNIRMILKFTVLIWSTYPVYLPDQGWFKFKLKLKFKFDPPSLLTRTRRMKQESRAPTDLISGFSEQLKSFCFQFTAIWTLKLGSHRSHLQLLYCPKLQNLWKWGFSILCRCWNYLKKVLMSKNDAIIYCG